MRGVCGRPTVSTISSYLQLCHPQRSFSVLPKSSLTFPPKSQHKPFNISSNSAKPISSMASNSTPHRQRPGPSQSSLCALATSAEAQQLRECSGTLSIRGPLNPTSTLILPALLAIMRFEFESWACVLKGNPADSRMRAAAKRRGIEITSISRPIRASDFRDFDLILAMDKQNREDILGAFERWRFKEALPADAHKKVKLMCSYCKKHEETEVPDPYYGGPQGFEKSILDDRDGNPLAVASRRFSTNYPIDFSISSALHACLRTVYLDFSEAEVLDLLEDGCESLLESIVSENSHIFNS
ncbi:hypothetical protein Syun_011190 [Stephania yunnanensis]|uniref:Phosphotyrosine protein phosphatase I domain-containing protein n=1 Tax=Stephania yunnanensis TaxID=152371 RepID=A0AAP0PHY5_9MAGN